MAEMGEVGIMNGPAVAASAARLSTLVPVLPFVPVRRFVFRI
jgi:hypothetical protein